jgi:hypothetical protein
LLADPHGRDFAVRDYRRALKDEKRAPSSVNAALASVDHFCRTIGVGAPDVGRGPVAGAGSKSSERG